MSKIERYVIGHVHLFHATVHTLYIDAWCAMNLGDLLRCGRVDRVIERPRIKQEKFLLFLVDRGRNQQVMPDAKRLHVRVHLRSDVTVLVLRKRRRRLRACLFPAAEAGSYRRLSWTRG